MGLRNLNPGFFALTLLFGGTGMIGCFSPGGGSDVPVTQTPEAPPPPDETPIESVPVSTQCTTTPIDRGLKGVTSGTTRGVFSSVQPIPGGGPSVAYTDTGSVTLKFTYWNGSDFITEVVSGDGAGLWVEHGFLSTGIPIIVYGHGAYLKAAMRTAPIGEVGTWNVSVIDVGIVARTASLSISPLDQVNVTWLTRNTSAGRPRFVFCPAGCTSLTQFQTMNTSTYIENTNIVANQFTIGTGWCNAGSGVYYPAAVYSGNTNRVRYAVCRKADLNECLSSASWDLQDVVTASSVSSRLLLDPSVVGDVPKVVSLRPSTGIKTYLMNGSTACSVAPTTFTQNAATLGGANSGNKWIDVMKDPSGKFHVVANENNTGVRYYNSTSNDFIGTWNPVGIIENVTLAATSGGGAYLDPETQSIFSAYGQSASYYDLKLSQIRDYSIPSNTSTTAYYYPDLNGGVLLSGTHYRNIRVRKRKDGVVGAVYVDYSVGTVAGAKLKFALRSGTAPEDTWNVVQIPGTQTPHYPSLAFDTNLRPWISYFEAGNNRFHLARNSKVDGTGTWQKFEFPAVPAGAPTALPAANDTSLVFRKQESETHLVMLVIDNNAGSRGVKAARFNPQTLLWSSVQTLDPLSTSGGAHLSSAADSNGNIVATFHDLTESKARYSYSNDGVSWPAGGFIFTGAGKGAGVRVAINPISGLPAAAYYDRATNRLYFSECTQSISDCHSGGWSETLIENNTLGISGLTAAQEQLLSAPIRFRPDGVAVVLYSRGAGSTGDLILASNLEDGTVGGNFSTSSIFSGVSPNLPSAAPVNYGMGGWVPTMAINTSQSITALHVGPGNWLYATRCGN